MELSDRFGTLPEAVTGLLYQLKVKLRAQRANASAVGNEDGQVFVKIFRVILLVLVPNGVPRPGDAEPETYWINLMTHTWIPLIINFHPII
jgi:hypothetical protein